MKRRKALQWTFIGAGAAAAGGIGGCAFLYDQALLDTVGKVDFASPLAIPPLAESTIDSAGTRVFNLEIQAGQRQFKDGPATPTWGVNGDYLGPTIRAKRGEEVAVAVHNGLDEATSLHWHGMHLPAVMDGGPHQEVAPGSDWTPQWTIDQPAATLWYHPHPHGQTAVHVYRGVAGMFIVDDEDTEALGLPSDYGADDVPLIVQDRQFDDDNRFDDAGAFGREIGILGPDILVNGTPGPYFDVSTRLVRMRILNASNARLYNFGFSDDRAFALIATDGGLLAETWETDRIQLSPGERVEIVVAFDPGETVDLRSYPADYGFADKRMSRFNGGDDKLDICRFRAGDTLSDASRIPADMGAALDIDDDEAAAERSFRLSGHGKINDQKMDIDRIDFGVRAGTTEVWEVVNGADYLHNFHVHDVQYQVLSIDGETPPPQLAGPKDTVQLIPEMRYRLAMRFADYTDPNLPYMFHCHVLFHEDQGMMGQFVVLGEGNEVGTVPERDNDHDHG